MKLATLRQKSKFFSQEDFSQKGAEILETILGMMKTVLDTKVQGMSAVQVGKHYPIIVYQDLTRKQIQHCINPEIESKLSKKLTLVRCNLFPGLASVVERYQRIRIKFYCINSRDELKLTRRTLTGEAAFVFQHYFDLMNGRTMFDSAYTLRQDFPAKKIYAVQSKKFGLNFYAEGTVMMMFGGIVNPFRQKMVVGFIEDTLKNKSDILDFVKGESSW